MIYEWIGSANGSANLIYFTLTRCNSEAAKGYHTKNCGWQPYGWYIHWQYRNINYQSEVGKHSPENQPLP